MRCYAAHEGHLDYFMSISFQHCTDLLHALEAIEILRGEVAQDERKHWLGTAVVVLKSLSYELGGLLGIASLA